MQVVFCATYAPPDASLYLETQFLTLQVRDHDLKNILVTNKKENLS